MQVQYGGSVKLTTRFLILTIILGTVVLISLGVADWAVLTVDREAHSSYGKITRVLGEMEDIERTMEPQIEGLKDRIFPVLSILGGEADIAEKKESGTLSFRDVSYFQNMNHRLLQAINRLDENPTYHQYAGVQVSVSMLDQFRSMQADLDRCYTAINDGDTDSFREILSLCLSRFDQVSEQMEDIESLLFDNVELSLAGITRIRTTITFILFVCLGLVGLAAVLVFLLHKRWIIEPVSRLRKATAELQLGHYDYRIHVKSRDELGLLSEEINDMAQTIVTIQGRLVERERLAAIGEMMRRIVHNLRNPLAGIRSLAELTQSELPPDSDECENQSRIVATVDRFEQWLEEVLRSTNPLEVKPRPVRLHTFINETIEPQKATAESRRIQLKTVLDQSPAVARIDPTHFQHVIIALVANAIEACPDNGIVQITVYGDEDDSQKNQCWHLLVEDSGGGVSTENEARIFEPYFTSKKHGSGIGLALVKNIVLAHKGTIEVTRSSLGGASFHITIPF